MKHILPNASILAGRTLGAGKPFEFIKAEVKIGVAFVYEEGESGKEIADTMDEVREQVIAETDATCSALLE